MQGCVNPDEFLRVVRPALASGDPHELAEVVAEKWAVADLCPLVAHPDVDVRRVAAVTLGLVGDMKVTGCLTRALADSDLQVNQMAEHGLWSIWFRACNPQAANVFRDGMAALATESFEQAIDCLTRTSQIAPDFAEAYNQRAIAHYMLEQWQASIACGLQALERVPTHFGALAGLGHCYMETGQWDLALACYRRAVRINPRMPAVVQTIRELEDCLRSRNDSSGMFQFREVSV